jgi:hypothetical protein
MSLPINVTPHLTTCAFDHPSERLNDPAPSIPATHWLTTAGCVIALCTAHRDALARALRDHTDNHATLTLGVPLTLEFHPAD